MIEPKKAELIIKETYDENYEYEKETIQHDIPEPEKACEEVPTTSTDDLGQKMISAIHEITSNDIKIENALKILAAHRHGADTEHSIANITGINAWTCKKVLDILHERGLLNLDIK